MVKGMGEQLERFHEEGKEAHSSGLSWSCWFPLFSQIRRRAGCPAQLVPDTEFSGAMPASCRDCVEEAGYPGPPALPPKAAPAQLPWREGCQQWAWGLGKNRGVPREPWCLKGGVVWRGTWSMGSTFYCCWESFFIPWALLTWWGILSTLHRRRSWPRCLRRRSPRL